MRSVSETTRMSASPYPGGGGLLGTPALLSVYPFSLQRSSLTRAQLTDGCLAGWRLDSTLLQTIWGPLSIPPAQRQRHSLNDPSMALHPKLANSPAAPRYKSLKLPEDFELSPWLSSMLQEGSF